MSKRDSKRSAMSKRAKQRAQERESSGQVSWMQVEDVEFFTPKKGLNTFDIIPYTVTRGDHSEVPKGETWYQKTVWVHYGIGLDEKNVACPLKTEGKKCPICEHRAELKKDPDATEQELNSLKPRQREVFNVRVKGDYMLFTTSYHSFGELLEEEIRESEDGDDEPFFAELKGGKSLKTRFMKKKFKTPDGQVGDYLKATKIEFKDRKDLPASVLKKVQNLDDIVVVLEYDELEKLFLELEATDSSSKGSKKKSASKKGSGKKHQREEEPEEEEEEEEPEEEEEEEEPEEEEEEEGEEEEEEEEEEDDGLDEMDRKELKAHIKSEGIDVKVLKSMSDDDIREAIREQQGEEEEPEEEEEEEEDDGLDEMDRAQLKSHIKSEKLSVKVFKSMSDDDIREAIRQEQGGGEEDDGDEGECTDCPHGHKFGKDTNETDECEDCECWEKCQDTYDKSK